MTLRLGMLGMHHPHAVGMARQIAAHPDEFQLVAGWDRDADVAATRRAEWRPDHAGFEVLDSAEAVLDSGIDAVVVEGHVHENVALARLAVERGFPVMLEKPAGVNLADYQALVDRAREQNLRVQLIYLFRYMSAVVEMLRLATWGALGDIYEFRARMPKDARLYDEYVPWYSGYQGGMYFEMAGHVVDMMVTMLGRPPADHAVSGATPRRRDRLDRPRCGHIRIPALLWHHRSQRLGRSRPTRGTSRSTAAAAPVPFPTSAAAIWPTRRRNRWTSISKTARTPTARSSHR